ncbi:hypothetical protein KXQ82_04285 [Mucilaginibacter sp. HMF5004]|uniref:hypothetical protein n=1 Tax=Mucilaginibacter rivuli TaxID=2857527 RepID=UPI001C5D003E|nr:hypothetical protein [Mucilaginibacter rivuli]MBW4888915.1 hypothetical protein [Mucilaginibacter rivuli]
MARLVKFTEEEQQRMIALLVNRQNQYDLFEGVPKWATGKINNILVKVRGAVSFSLTPSETALCIGCINELMTAVYKEKKVTSAYDLLHINAEQRSLIEQIDTGKDMLFKLGYQSRNRCREYNFDVRYRDALAAIENMRRCQQICFSQSGEEVYKIGFITEQQEVFSWRLNQEPAIYDIRTVSASLGGISDFKKRFTTVSNREEASAIFKRYHNADYISARFFEEILSSSKDIVS